MIFNTFIFPAALPTKAEKKPENVAKLLPSKSVVKLDRDCAFQNLCKQFLKTLNLESTYTQHTPGFHDYS